MLHSSIISQTGHVTIHEIYGGVEFFLLENSSGVARSAMKLRERRGNLRRGALSRWARGISSYLFGASRHMQARRGRRLFTIGRPLPLAALSRHFHPPPLSDGPTSKSNRPGTREHRTEKLEVTWNSHRLPPRSVQIDQAVVAGSEALHRTGGATNLRVEVGKPDADLPVAGARCKREAFRALPLREWNSVERYSVANDSHSVR